MRRRTRISDTLRKRVAKRAGFRCEFCQSSQETSAETFEIDHAIPLSHGGVSEFGNLSFTCSNCNGAKHARLTADDPETGRMVMLFNPRRQKWERHFEWSEDSLRLVGRTATGRATVSALRMNRERAVEVRRLLSLLGRHPPPES